MSRTCMGLSYNLLCFLVGLGLGVLTETAAWRLGLWRYESRVTPILNVVVMFGLVHGLVLAGVVGAHRHSAIGIPLLFMNGVFIGVGYEALNQFKLGAWTWGDRSLLGIRRPVDKAATVGVAWGAAPVITFLIAKALLNR